MLSAKQKRIKRKKRYAQNRDAAKLFMKEYREKKKDLIQLSNNEYYKSNEYKIKSSKKVNYEGNKDAKRQYYVENKDDKRLYYEKKYDKKIMKKTRISRRNIFRNIISKKRTKNNITTKSTIGFSE